MRPKFDHLIKRPDGKRYDMGAPTDLKAKFDAIRKEQARQAKETAQVVKPIRKKVA